MRKLNRTGRVGVRVADQRLVHFQPTRCSNCQCGVRVSAASNTDILWPEESLRSNPQGQDVREGATAELSISSKAFHQAVAVLFGGPLAGLFVLLVLASRVPVLLAIALTIGSLLLWWRLVSRYGPALQRQLVPRLRMR